MRYAGTKRLSVLLCLLAVVAASAVRAQVQDIYPDPAQATGDIAAALKHAAATHKRVLLDFGGNWCTDCHVLDMYFHDSANRPILESNYVLVHINVGHMDENLSIAERYQVPLSRGVPALAVLNSRGKLLYSQSSGEFEAMRHLQSAAVTDFLAHWKPPAVRTATGAGH
jgi:thioredoxin 1